MNLIKLNLQMAHLRIRIYVNDVNCVLGCSSKEASNSWLEPHLSSTTLI